jgi:pyridoxal phosphate-dependent aminotransferase EpsN
MGGTEQDFVQKAFESNFIAPIGPALDQFEAEVSNYLGGGVNCVALSSGSAALHLALHMMSLNKEDEVWVSSMTFAGGCFPILYESATPVFLDLAESSWTLDPDLVEQALERANTRNSLPKAIIPTDLYGMGCDINRLEEVTKRFGVKLIVDAAESLGASAHGRKCGSGGDASILSFNGNKIITTSGGGMLVSRSAELVERARFLATQARDPAAHYEHSVLGFNYRLSNLCASVGIGQLEVLDQRVQERRAVFGRYIESLSMLPGLSFMPEPNWSHGSRWLSSIRIDPKEAGITREDVRLALSDHEIESRPLWKPMHLQPVFKKARYIGEGLDERLFSEGLCLPSGSDLTYDEQKEVCDIIHDVFN